MSPLHQAPRASDEATPTPVSSPVLSRDNVVSAVRHGLGAVLAAVTLSGTAHAQQSPIITSDTPPQTYVTRDGRTSVTVSVEKVEPTFQAKDGKMLTASQIRSLTRKEREDVLKPSQHAKFIEWSISSGNSIDEALSAQLEEGYMKIVTGLEQLLKVGQKLKEQDRQSLERIISHGKPPDAVEKAKILYNNPQNFA